MEEERKEFAQLLYIKDRKKINKWKRDKGYVYGIDCKLYTDADIVEQLFETGEGVEWKKYIKYLDEEDPCDRDCKFRNSKSKQQFINDYLA